MVPSLVIVGRGRVGGLAAELALRGRVSAILLGRDDDPAPVSRPNPGRPILVCTRNDDLDGLYQDVHPDNRLDLVFVQNGMIRPWLEAHGLLGCTQGLLYVAVPRVGARPEPGGESVFHGPWAEDIAALFRAGGLPARCQPERDVFLREVCVKFAWNCVFGLLGEVTGSPVGVLADQRVAAVWTLCAEMAPVLALELGVSLPVGPLQEQVLGYARRIPGYRATLKELRWRNGWLVAAAARRRLALPEHSAWMARAQAD